MNAVTDAGYQLPEQQRAALAVYCYRRAHFRRLGLSLASLCSQQALVMEAGHAGDLIYRQASSAGFAGEGDTGSRTAKTGKPPVSLYVV
ncbi:hypothetical protein [Roseibium sp. LAB1]